MIRTGYEIFVRNLEELEGGKELDKQIRSAETYEMKKVGLIKIFKLFCNQRKKKGGIYVK